MLQKMDNIHVKAQVQSVMCLGKAHMGPLSDSRCMYAMGPVLLLANDFEWAQ